MQKRIISPTPNQKHSSICDMLSFLRAPKVRSGHRDFFLNFFSLTFSSDLNDLLVVKNRVYHFALDSNSEHILDINSTDDIKKFVAHPKTFKVMETKPYRLNQEMMPNDLVLIKNQLTIKKNE